MFSPLGRNAHVCSNYFTLCLNELKRLSSYSVSYVKSNESDELKNVAAFLCAHGFACGGDFFITGNLSND